MVSPGTLGGNPYSLAWGVNDSGAVVGESGPYGGSPANHAFIYRTVVAGFAILLTLGLALVVFLAAGRRAPQFSTNRPVRSLAPSRSLTDPAPPRRLVCAPGRMAVSLHRRPPLKGIQSP
jgi:hypothetical protein